jgi:hypothetical protein
MLSASFVLASLVSLAFAQSALATHVRPKGATPKRDSLVISYKPCTTPTGSHTGPQNYQSCLPQVPSSRWLTAGTPDANSLPANFTGFTKMDYCPPPSGCSPGPPGADIQITVNLMDIRCTAMQVSTNPAVCPSGTLGPFTGSVRARFPTQVTDHCNGSPAPTCPAPTPPPANSGTGPPVGFNLVMAFVAPCAPAGPGIGATCGLVSTYNALVPGSVIAGARANVEVSRITVEDGGPDGNGATTDNDEFADEGLFVP